MELEAPVLVAVGFRDDWDNLVAHAAREAWAMGAPLELVHVITRPNWLVRQVVGEEALDKQHAELTESAQRRLQAALDRHTDGIGTVTILEGKPVVAIAEHAHTCKARLLVCGAGVPSAADHLFVGTTADRLLRRSPVPVYIASRRQPMPRQHILVPTGLGPSGQAALELALSVASRNGAQVTCLHTVAVPGVMRAYSGDVLRLKERLSEAAEREMAAFVARVKVPEGVPPVQGRIRLDPDEAYTAEAIVEVQQELGADLLVMALGRRLTEQGPLVGHTAERLVRQLPCDLLAIPQAVAG